MMGGWKTGPEFELKRHKQLVHKGMKIEGRGRNKGESSSAVTPGGGLLMTNLMEPHFQSAAHLTAPVWTLSPSPLLFISLFLSVLW